MSDQTCPNCQRARCGAGWLHLNEARDGIDKGYTEAMWRECVEATVKRAEKAEATLLRLRALAALWVERGGYARGVYAHDLTLVLDGTVGGMSR